MVSACNLVHEHTTNADRTSIDNQEDATDIEGQYTATNRRVLANSRSPAAIKEQSYLK